jgi:hypothetical protein
MEPEEVTEEPMVTVRVQDEQQRATAKLEENQWRRKHMQFFFFFSLFSYCAVIEGDKMSQPKTTNRK